MIKEAQLYQPLEGGRVKCTACARYCNIPEGKIGFCGVRQNTGGKLQLLVYGKVITGHIDPIEKKPVTHYMPGSKIFSIATTGCSRACQGIAYTYNQPTIFIEFARDVGLEAHKKGLINIFVSNGYDTPDAVGMMNEFLDCITVDFKGNNETGFLRKWVLVPDGEPILRTLLDIRDKTKIHTEIT